VGVPDGSKDEDVFSRDLVCSVARLDGSDCSTELEPAQKGMRMSVCLGFRRKRRNSHGRHQALLETGRRAYCAVDLWELREELALTDCKLRGRSQDADCADGLRQVHSRITEITPEEGNKEGESFNTSSLPNERATRLGRNRTKIHHFNEESDEVSRCFCYAG
jgi:hypothetical protein